MRAPGLAGVMWAGRGQTVFPVVTERAAGNQLPGITGDLGPRFRPAPGYWHVNGQLGSYDGNVGDDPRLSGPRRLQPYPKSSLTASGEYAEGQVSRPGAKTTDGTPAIPYGGTGSERLSGIGRWGNASRNTQRFGEPADPGPHPSWWRGAIQGFNDKLTTKDRHVYFDTGHQRTGTSFIPEGALPNSYNNPVQQPPMPLLRSVNRTVSYQIGTDKTRNQDDLSRPYTWLGEQGATWTPVNGGVPGMYQPYGTRGGVPYPIVSPVEEGSPNDGPRIVSDGPPHGLHTQTPWKGGAQLIRRYGSIPQMRPVRLDRPSNSPQAGQSYSQTVQPQGQSRVRPSAAQGARFAGPMTHSGRGWAGRGGPRGTRGAGE